MRHRQSRCLNKKLAVEDRLEGVEDGREKEYSDL